MLEDLSRTETTPPQIEEVEFNSLGPRDPRWPAAFHYTHNIISPSFRKSFERLLTDNKGVHANWKPCQHYSCYTGSHSPMGGSIISSWQYAGSDATCATGVMKNPHMFYDGAFGDAGQLNNGLPALYAPQPDGGFIPPPADLSQLENRALASMLPVVKSELSLVNSLIELKDFVTLKQHVQRAKSDATRLVASFLRSNPRAVLRPGQVLRTILRQAAGNFLQWKFNFAPLVSDIQGIYHALKTVERRMNDLVTRSGRVQSKHFAFNWLEYPNVDPESHIVSILQQFDTTIPTSVKFTRSVIQEPTSFHAQIQYNYNYTGYQVEHARLLGTLDALGVNLNPAIIWNAIPWSFVVDWVFGVSRYLNNYASANMRPQINIHRYLWSVLRKRRIYTTRRTTWSTFSYSQLDSNEVQLPIVYEEAYRRHVGLPAHSSIVSSGLNSQEFTLGAALVLSRRGRRRR